MRKMASIRAMQALALGWRRSGTRVAFVPTMGYLHEGHISLVRKARDLVGKRGKVVLSIYVNPTQFAPTEDLSRYPRDLPRDLRLCREAGVNLVFTPTDAAMYPGKSEGRYSTFVVEEKLGRGMEGCSRPTHFRGVTTVVAKLFQIVLPDFAVFGAKDWQQAAVVRRMVKDLNFPVRIVVAPTVRERDGLALSSRNVYLTPAQRAGATVLSRSIREVRAWVRREKEGVSSDALRGQVASWVAGVEGALLDYVEFFDPDSLEPTDVANRGTHMAIAVFFGKTRLIDNGRL